MATSRYTLMPDEFPPRPRTLPGAYPHLLRSSALPLLVVRSQHTLVQVPLVAGARQAAADLVGKGLTELEAPLPHGFMADVDAAGGEDLIDVAQAERKAEIQPNSEPDDLGWEAVAGVAGWGGRGH